MSKIQLPETIEAATSALDGLGKLLQAKEWEKAAIVYAFTYMPGQGARTDTSRISAKLTPSEFAKLGIHGLGHGETVRIYHRAWIDGKGDPNIGPGDSVILPTGKFAPTDPRSGNFDDRIVTQVRNAKPEVQEEVIREIAKTRPETVGHVAAETPAAMNAAFQRSAEMRPRMTPEGQARAERSTEAITIAFLPAALARKVIREIRDTFRAWYATTPVEADAFLQFLEEAVADMRVSKSASVSDEEIAAFMESANEGGQE